MFIKKLLTRVGFLVTFCMLVSCKNISTGDSNPKNIETSKIISSTNDSHPSLTLEETLGNSEKTTSYSKNDILLEKENELINKINNSVAYDKLVTVSTDINLFIRAFDNNPYSQFNGKTVHLTEVKETIGLQCLRKKEDGTLYSIHKIKQGGILYIFYNTYADNKSYIRNWYYVKENLTYNNFEKIKIGMDIQKVNKIDPATSIYIDRLNNYEATYETSTSSFHYLQDGILCYTYEKVNGHFIITDLKFDPNFHVLTYSNASEKLVDGKIFPIDKLK